MIHFQWQEATSPQRLSAAERAAFRDSECHNRPPQALARNTARVDGILDGEQRLWSSARSGFSCAIGSGEV
jgi:hypothetical protein